METGEKTQSKKIKDISKALLVTTALTLGSVSGHAQEQHDDMGKESPAELTYKLYLGGIASSNDEYLPTEFGFNTHIFANSGENDEELLDLDRFKNTVDELSANNQSWIRFNIPRWEGVKLTEGQLIWNEAELSVFDEAMKYAKDKKLEIFLVATPPPVDKSTNKEDYAKVTSDYFSYIAQRYKDSIDVWQINNEIDVHHPADYTYNEFEKRDKEFIEAHVKAASESIRAQDPRANITVNVTGWPVTDDVQRNWEEYIEPLLPYINAISLDLYPDGNISQIESLSERVESMREKFHLPIYVSETGVCTVGCNLNGMSQKEILIRILDDLIEAKPKAIIMYEYTDETLTGFANKNDNQVEGSFGITDLQGNKKEGYYEILNKMQKEK